MGGQSQWALPKHDRSVTPQDPPDGGKPLKNVALLRCISHNKGGLNAKLRAVCDDEGRSIVVMLAEGQMSDHKGADLLFGALPNAKEPLGDNGYDSDWFRTALRAHNITTCSRSKPTTRFNMTTKKV